MRKFKICQMIVIWIVKFFFTDVKAEWKYGRLEKCII
jgi:hypothetical protein